MIEIQDVSKQFDCVTALRHLTLEVQDGSVFGLVGSNGAGKSTLLRILAGVYRPDSGRVLINGQAPLRTSRSSAALCLSRTFRILLPPPPCGGWHGCTAACIPGGARTTLPGWKSCSPFPLTLGWAR